MIRVAERHQLHIKFLPPHYVPHHKCVSAHCDISVYLQKSYWCYHKHKNLPEEIKQREKNRQTCQLRFGIFNLSTNQFRFFFAFDRKFHEDFPRWFSINFPFFFRLRYFRVCTILSKALNFEFFDGSCEFRLNWLLRDYWKLIRAFESLQELLRSTTILRIIE